MQMCAAFASNGIAVKLVASTPEAGCLTVAELQQYYDVPHNFEIEQFALPSGLRASDRFQLQTLWKEQGKVNLCYTRGRDVTAPLLALALGIPAIVETHTPPASARERWILRLIQAHPRGQLVVLTESLRSHYVHSLRFRPDRLTIAPDGVDLRRFEPPINTNEARRHLGLDKGKWIIYVGGLYKGRGLNTLFRATADLPLKKLIVGGRDAVEIGKWQCRAQELGAHEIHFSGYQPPARVPLYLAAADILVMPYNTRVFTGNGQEIANWTSPLKMFEYMAAARPIVATNLPMVRGVLKNEHNALLVPPGDASALRAALQRLAASHELGERLATEAHSDVAQHTWKARARHILANVGVN